MVGTGLSGGLALQSLAMRRRWPVLCSSEAHGVLRGPFFVSGADADGDVGVPVGMQAVWWGRAEWWPCATILGHAGGWPSRV